MHHAKMGACASVPDLESTSLGSNIDVKDPTIHDFIAVDCKGVYSSDLLTNRLFMKWQKEFELESIILYAYDVIDTPPKVITKETFSVFNDLYETYRDWFYACSMDHPNYYTIKHNYIALATLKYYLNYLCIKINKSYGNFTEDYVEKSTKNLKRDIRHALARY